MTDYSYIIFAVIVALIVVILFLGKKKADAEDKITEKGRELAEYQQEAEEKLKSLSLQLDRQKDFYEKRISLLGIHDIEEAAEKLNELRRQIADDNSEIKELESKLSVLRPEAEAIDSKITQFESKKKNSYLHSVDEKPHLKHSFAV